MPNFTKIVFITLRTNLFYIVLLTFLFAANNSYLYSQDVNKKTVVVPIKAQKDTTFVGLSTLSKKNDTVKNQNGKVKKPLIESKIRYTAVDYVKMNQKTKTVTLYNKAELYYQDIELKSGIIVLNNDKSEVYAGRIKDSTGKYTQLPVFKQGSNVIEPDSIRFNFKTKKALIWNSRTEQDEFKVKAEITKRVNDSVYFMKKARFTTAKDLEHPDYYFQTYRVKFVPGKKVVTGLTNLVIADVPTPLALPFAYFPLSKETRTSGIIMPIFADNSQRGYSLQNGGYYFALSDNYDLAVLGDYYTNGGYALRFESSYAKRYRFRGNFSLRFENLINSERGLPDYSKTNNYNINWSHSKDSKSSPNSSFTASVNMGSSKFFQNTYNQNYAGSRLNNTLSSSISYTKRFNSVPQVNLAVAATQSQNTQNQQINLSLPNLTLNVDRVYPFAPKDGLKKGFIKNINLQYSLAGRNDIATTDSLFLKKAMFDDAKVGMQHTIPISTNFKIFKYFSASTNLNYNEVWGIKTIKRNFDSNLNSVITSNVNGFDAFRTYSFSTSLGTTIYGTFNFGENKKIKSIRHVVRPSISYSYTPSFAKYYDTYATDASGTIRKDYTRFENSIFGTPGKTMSNNIGFSLSNTFEAKVRDNDTTKVEPKKIMLINNLNLSTSYDITADSLKLAPLRISGGTQLLNNKMNINFGTTLNPYALNNKGQMINKWNINNGGSLLRMTSANMTMNYSIASSSKEDKKKKEKDNVNAQNGGRTDDLFGRNMDLSNQRQSLFDKEDDESDQKDTGFFNTKITWDLTMAYSLTYSNTAREDQISGNSLMVSGNISLTPKWKMGVSTGYDFVQKGVTYTNFRMERDLDSWRMSFNWIPFGTYTSWGFFIGIKSSILKDIKWEKNKIPDRVLR
ncbi:organic solvent tolerance protein OstA [Flavobacterium branchiophilum NBRC 15030 = ATCC 35035]|uniref:Lipopolysaccharide assembly outer membrane protein LptD (OstA) n=1 Tax=Flavobacterium branchiophilum TaxID=55197 RepID=A0A543G6F6_9FLAO|nr:putative LPS assembly protein LptD [Flavobacterium branchiophilum]OXA73279.1 organic solvent tolerance protein OstA [Flavobacterium branchiophilum NBRC 15030 = ATCC 35035]TQM41673.1 lipopolysaccharide assembly outer membrane protein LptD (OstA) [Flavobacterium branchiophilum]GEM56026.1 organic solvent tolerance protein OstA [Flavobacterium branchiophilum NBRC 15030 = ATCC 35035]